MVEIHARLQSRHAARRSRGDHARRLRRLLNYRYNKKKEAKGLPSRMML
jgi:hypothetical protein